ncbi:MULTISPECIES: ATP-binding cassette domain-containing protein [Helicobacter]|uniref:ATP-binding cassette domain-containing protein n=1 Tax=Helicobacter TaxID=209 RepID=UPI00051DB79D|nr:ATP-binding cassette domain-containing protein [Helicobacter sp. MIT 03-1616]TLD88302.1 ATP-binding cassette domain-containing protein [Helicobacter sp. MIT 03-1616]
MSDIHLRFSKTLLGSEGTFKLEVDKQLQFGEFVALFGKSGAGKTTILRILSGLESVENGYIRVGESVWLDSQNGICLPPQKRCIGFVFQHHALFPHLNVYDNICFALKDKKDRIFADELIARMDLTPLKKSKISQLSGGQSQRVALARSLISRPQILLLDEPFSALDNAMRRILQDTLKALHKHFGLTTILVSHSMSEIFALASRTFVLQNGHITRDGSNDSIFTHKLLSAKLKLKGEIIHIHKEALVCVISVLCNDEIYKIIYDPIECAQFHIGEQVIIADKAFSPILYKCDIE